MRKVMQKFWKYQQFLQNLQIMRNNVLCVFKNKAGLIH